MGSWLACCCFGSSAKELVVAEARDFLKLASVFRLAALVYWIAPQLVVSRRIHGPVWSLPTAHGDVASGTVGYKIDVKA